MSSPMQTDKQRLVELGPDEEWTPFLEQVNDLMIEEKKARHEGDYEKISDICLRVVSLFPQLFLLDPTFLRQQTVCQDARVHKPAG